MDIPVIVWKRLGLAATALTMGSFVGTMYLAWCAHGVAGLGTPLWTFGQVPLYHPFAGWAWFWQWGSVTSPVFRMAGLLCVGVVMLCCLRGKHWKANRETAQARWATRRVL